VNESAELKVPLGTDEIISRRSSHFVDCTGSDNDIEYCNFYATLHDKSKFSDLRISNYIIISARNSLRSHDFMTDRNVHINIIVLLTLLLTLGIFTPEGTKKNNHRQHGSADLL